MSESSRGETLDRILSLARRLRLVDEGADGSSSGAVDEGVVELLLSLVEPTRGEPSSATAVLTVRAPAAATPSIGSAVELPPYRDAEVINRGGMGVIVQAFDPSTGRDVAIKVLRAGGSDWVRRKFLAEGRVTAQLEHPNIVPIHEIETAPDGQPYFSMKLVRGQSLSARLKVDRPGPEARPGLLSDFLKMCDALSYAHSRGVIHRDLKPANVMLGEFGEVLVMDWGLARVLGRSEADAEPVDARGWDGPEDEAVQATRVGSVIGTLQYMPPEQATGRVDQVDERSDVYALGAILYEILTLEPAFAGSTRAQIQKAVCKGDLVPPGVRAPDRSIPRELEAVVARAMAFRKEDRYPSARALKEDVEAFLAGRFLQAARYTVWQRVAKWARRHRAWAAPAAILALVLAGLGLHAATRPGHLVVDARPTGARVEVAGESWTASGEPVRLRVPPGRHEIRVTLEDHVPAVREEHVDRNESREVAVELAHETGTLTLATDPEGGMVELDGAFHGTPLVGQVLPTGRRTLRVEKRGHYRERVEVDVRAGRDSALEVPLTSAAAWRRAGSDWTPGESAGDVDGDGVDDILYVHFWQVVRVLSGATGATLLERTFPVEAETPSAAIDVDGDGVREWVTALVDAPGAVLAAISLRTARPVWSTARLEVRTQLETGTGKGPGPAIWFAPDLDGDGRSDVFAWLEGPALAAYSTSNGAELWRTAVPAAGVVLGDRDRNGDRRGELLLVAGGVVRSLDGATGGQRWEFAAGGPVPWDLSLPDGGWVLPSADGLVLLDGETGRTTLREASLPTAVPSWQVGPLAIFVFEAGLEAWDLAASRRAWRRSLRLDPGRSRLDGSRIHGVAPDGLSLEAIDPTDGRTAWTWRSDRGPIERMARGPGGLLLVCGAIVTELDEASGTVRWSYAAPAPVSCDPVLADLEGDGSVDVLLGTAAGHWIELGDRGEEAASARLYGAVTALRPFHADGDGLLDCVVESLSGPTVVRGRKTIWQRTFAGSLRAAPVLAGRDPILPATVAGRGEAIVRLDGRTGATLWSAEFGHNMIRPLALADVAGDSGPEVVAWTTGAAMRLLDPGTGAILRDVPVPAGGYADPVAADVDGDGRADLLSLGWWEEGASAAIAGGSFERLWEVRPGGAMWSGASVGDAERDGRLDLWLATTGGDVLCLDARTGEVRWRRRAAGAVRAGVAVGSFEPAGPVVVAVNAYAAPNGALQIHDAATGEPLVSAPGAGGTTSRPVFADVDGDGVQEIVVGTAGAGLVAIDAGGRARWQSPADRIDATPVVADLEGDGRLEVVVGDMAGVLRVVDLATGRVLWSWASGSGQPIEADVALADEDGDGVLDVLVVGKDGTITCLTGRGAMRSR